jgi:hypothetical protein
MANTVADSATTISNGHSVSFVEVFKSKNGFNPNLKSMPSEKDMQNKRLHEGDSDVQRCVILKTKV